MRLICPSCSAEYEVDPSVIPPGGRDVQCSNCSVTWFQAHPDTEKVSPEEKKLIGQIAGRRDTEDGEPAPRRSRVAIQRAAMHDTDSTPSTAAPPQAPPAAAAAEGTVARMPDEDDDDDGHDDPPRALPRRAIDEEVLQVLRAEADRESRVRRGQPLEALESEPELSLGGSAPNRSGRVPTDPRDLTEEDDTPSGTISRRRRPGAGREVLPNIEDINSTLRASSDRRSSVPAYLEVEATLRKMRRGQGFRLGFSLVLLAVAGAIFAYLFAPEIAGRMPAARPWLERYVAEVNEARLWLDVTVRDLSARLRLLVTDRT